MKEFEDYLHEQHYSDTTIVTYSRHQALFLNWCELNEFVPEHIDYKSCLAYVKTLRRIDKKGKQKAKKTVKHIIGGLKIYFNYLVDQEIRGNNPFESINIRGIKRTVNHNLLEYEELEDLYYSYSTEEIKKPSTPSVAFRNKVITGFMVYQGMNTTAIKSLKVEHLDIEKGTIYIPRTRKTNARKLELKSRQIMPLMAYVSKHREILQEELNNHTEALFPLNSDRYEIIVSQLIKNLKQFNHRVTGVKQIRASVITYWLKQHNIREVQYMTGHRYISSTERYLQDDLESLHEMIENLHPIS